MPLARDLKSTLSITAIFGALAISGTAVNAQADTTEKHTIACKTAAAMKKDMAQYNEKPTTHKGETQYWRVVVYANKTTGAWSLIGHYKNYESINMPQGHLCHIHGSDTGYPNITKQKWYKRFNIKGAAPKAVP